MRGSAGQPARAIIASSGAARSAQPAEESFDTQLTPGEEQQYQAWAKETGREGDTLDYDQRGAWKSGWRPKTRDEHGDDTYKKPNHPTFSSDSVHSKPGREGGKWDKLPNGKWTFTPSPLNIRNLGVEGLQRYFKEREPDSQLILPAERIR